MRLHWKWSLLTLVVILVSCMPATPPAMPASASVPTAPFRLAAHTLFLDEGMAVLAKEAGFDTIVQVFPWKDLNPQPGRYNWDVGDAMVGVAQRRKLALVVRLDMSPEWARWGDPARPPFDTGAYLDFVEATARRYQGRILAYIVGNEPNLAVEWGGWVAEPAQYGELLCEAAGRIRAADPQALVVAAGMAPTNEFSDRAMDDRAFVEQLLTPEVVGCFDVLAVHDYGYGLPPGDPYGAHGGLNLARLLDLERLLRQAGGGQPLWITELGYTIEPGPHPPVLPREQAAYLVESLQRVRTEWSQVTLFTVWNLSTGGNSEMQGFSLVEPDGKPRPAFWAFKALYRRGSRRFWAERWPRWLQCPALEAEVDSRK